MRGFQGRSGGLCGPLPATIEALEELVSTVTAAHTATGCCGVSECVIVVCLYVCVCACVRVCVCVCAFAYMYKPQCRL